jgi:phosphatidylserine decarboxylase
VSGHPVAPPAARGPVPFAREGYPLIGGTAAAGVLFWLLGWSSLATVALAACAFCALFFRDPERTVPSDPSTILAPADGRVIKVAAVNDERFLGGPATLVSIFMSPLDVHINRAPISGRVIDIRYTAGKYFRAFADKASLDNEQNAVVVEDPRGRRLCVVQIAGFVARRIVCHLQIGMAMERGQRYGMIMFGSRADVYLPPVARVRVQVGDRARGGKTILAEWT